MPPCTEYEPHNIFNDDLIKGTSFIDLLKSSSDVNMSCYMSDEETVGLPLPSSSDLSPIGGSVNLLEFMNQDAMLGNKLEGAVSSTSREGSCVTQGSAPSAAPSTSAVDVFLPPESSATVTKTTEKPHETSNVSSLSTNQIAETSLSLSPRLLHHEDSSAETSQPTNQSPVDPVDSIQKQLVRNEFAATTPIGNENDPNTFKASSNSSKKSKSKSHCGQKCSSHSKLIKKMSHSSSKVQNVFLISSPQHVPASTRSDLRSTTLLHQRTTNMTLTTETVTHTVAIIAQTIDSCSASDAKTAATSSTATTLPSVLDATGALGGVTNLERTPMRSSYTVIESCAPTSPFLSRLLYSSPTIITRKLTAADRTEQLSLLSPQIAHVKPACSVDSSASETDAVPHNRNRILSFNAFTTSAASVDTASLSDIRCAIPSIRPFERSNSSSYLATHAVSTTVDTSTVIATTHSNHAFALSAGGTLYAAKHFKKPVSAESHTFTIVDGKGSCKTLTISSGLTTTGSPLVTTRTQNTTAVTAGVSNTLPATVVRSRNQLIIPIPKTQLNASTGYFECSPIDSDTVTSESSAIMPTTLSTGTTTTVSQSITTRSSEALSKLRGRLIYNVPCTTAGPGTDSSRPRGPITIIANQLVSARSSRAPTAPRAIIFAAPQGLHVPITCTATSTSPAEPATRPVHRVVMPINVHTTSTGYSSVSTQGAYIIADVSTSPTRAGGAVTRPSRVVIPIKDTRAAAVASSSSASAGETTTSTSASIVATADHSKTRRRLTTRVDSTEISTSETTDPVTTYTISGPRTPGVCSISTGVVSKASEGSGSPSLVSLITLTPPSAGGGPQRSPSATRCDTPSPTSTVASTGIRSAIKLASSASAESISSASTVTTSITTPIASANLSPIRHQFAEPHPVSSRLRTFPGPRTSLPQRYPAPTGNAPQRPVARNINPRFKKVIANPAPLQIFADVVGQPKTAPPQSAIEATPSQSKSRITRSHPPR